MSQSLLFGVVGHPVTHSLSPRIHQFWYDDVGLDAAYHALDLVSESAKDDIQALARAGYSGLNVTLPHKLSAFDAARDLSDAARAIGAVNTLKSSGLSDDKRSWSGDNTDWTGFLWSLDRFCPDLPDEAVLIGAGGAARAVAYALKSRGIKLTLLNRTVEKAEALATEMALDVSRVTNLDDLAAACDGAKLVINTVSLGHTGGQLTLPATEDGYFLDISYGKAAASTLSAAKSAGWAIEDGLPMLIGQAADAFNIWFGTQPDREAALKAARGWTAG
jgi:shikimate dehydrogenase